MPRQNFNSAEDRARANAAMARRLAELMATHPPLLTRLFDAPTLPPPKERLMNDKPATSGFMTGLDRKIEASKRRAAEERAAAGHGKPPTQGLTDTASTPNNNIPLRRLTPQDIESSALEVSVPLKPPIGLIPEAIAAASGCTVSSAFERLKLAMQQDPHFACGWHDNLAMAFFDAEQDETLMSEREHANRAASLFMELCFDVDTTEHAKRVTEKEHMDEMNNVAALINSITAGQAQAMREFMNKGPLAYPEVEELIERDIKAGHKWLIGEFGKL